MSIGLYLGNLSARKLSNCVSLSGILFFCVLLILPLSRGVPVPEEQVGYNLNNAMLFYHFLSYCDDYFTGYFPVDHTT